MRRCHEPLSIHKGKAWLLKTTPGPFGASVCFYVDDDNKDPSILIINAEDTEEETEYLLV